jgi:cell wall-associated NlpC family hydrolase
VLVRPRLAVVVVACAVAVLAPVGLASAGTVPTPSDTAALTPTPSTEPTPSESATDAVPSPSSANPTLPAPPPTVPLPTASSDVVPAPTTDPSAAPDRIDPVEPLPPNDGVQPALGQVDEYLRQSAALESLLADVREARAARASADLAVVIASQRAMRAALDVAVARQTTAVADGDATDVVRELYQQGDSGVANLATVMTLGPDGMLERLYNLRAMRGAATQVVRGAEQAAVDLAVAEVARTSAVEVLRAAIAKRDTASVDAGRVQREIVNARAQLARLGLVAPQVAVGSEGCPTLDVPATLRDGSEGIGAAALCRYAVKRAATPQAALAITWAFQHLGAAYACGGVGRMLPFRADCSSFVSRAYAEGAGLNTAGDTWAPSTRNMVPWDGVALDPHYAYVATKALRPGDLVLYDTCPQGGCPYKHVVMYLGAPGGGTPWMLHTNSCGDVAKVEQFWGFPTTGSHTFLVARRVLPVAGEKVTFAAGTKTPGAGAAVGPAPAAGSIG